MFAYFSQQFFININNVDKSSIKNIDNPSFQIWCNHKKRNNNDGNVNAPA